MYLGSLGGFQFDLDHRHSQSFWLCLYVRLRVIEVEHVDAFTSSRRGRTCLFEECSGLKSNAHTESQVWSQLNFPYVWLISCQRRRHPVVEEVQLNDTSKVARVLDSRGWKERLILLTMSLVAVGACYVDTILTSVWHSLHSRAHTLAVVSSQKEKKRKYLLISNYRTPHYPSEDEKLRASTLSRRRGGNCPNSLEVLQQLLEHDSRSSNNNNTPNPDSLNLNLVAVLPARSSVATQQIRAAFEPRVSLENSINRESFTEPASSYIIKSLDSGTRTIVNYNELPEMTFEEFKGVADGLGGRARWFHFEVCFWLFSSFFFLVFL